MWQIYANEIPLGHIHTADFVELVTKQDVRPERPENEDAPQLSDALWALAEQCWIKDPKRRPTAGAVCDAVSHLLNTDIGTHQTPVPSPSHLTNSSQAMSQMHALKASGELSISSARESGTSVQSRSGPVCESESIIKAAAEPQSPESEDQEPDEEFILVAEEHPDNADLILESIPRDPQVIELLFACFYVVDLCRYRRTAQLLTSP